MALTGNKADLILGLKLSEFFSASKRAQVEYTKTKGKIEGSPIKLKQVGAGDLLKKIGGIGAAYLAVTRYIPQFIRLSDVQERAESRLATALKNAGDATQDTLNKQMEFASWIQEVTTVGDEQSLMLQSMALNMQAPIDKTEEVTKNAIALSKAFKLDMNVAMRAAVSALDDNYTMLTRYIPAIRTATDETQKAAVYQRAVSDGWKTATEELETNAGSMEDFQNTLGDLKEDLGDFIKNVLIPLIKVIEPVIGSFTSLDKGTQQASVAIAALLLVGTRVPAMFTTIRTSIIALNASLGPAGWLILGISAAATAWGIYSANAEDAAKANEKFNKSTYGLSGIEIHLKKLDEAMRDVATKGIDKLIRIRERLYLRMQWAQEKNNEKLYNSYKSYYERVGELIEKYEKDIRQKKGIPGKEEIKPMTDLFMPDVDQIEAAQKDVINKTVDYNFELSDISTQFHDMGMAQLDDEYFRRSQYINDTLELVRDKLGEESQLYQQLSLQKWAVDQNYNQQKSSLEEASIRRSIGLLSEFMNVFQGQTKILFEVGKAAAIAKTLITQAEAIARAYKDYPFPFNIGIAAIQAALVAGQIIKIQSVNFKPKGKKLGGVIRSEDIAGFAFTPPGEDGLIAAQIGEMIMNRSATRRFYPLLEELNKEGRRGFQTGGVVNEASLSGISSKQQWNLFLARIEDSIVSGFNKSNLRVYGEFTQRGRDMKAVLDRISNLEEQL